ncbi:MAG: hypothetical protein QXU48_05990 [Thermoplasmata archaeon]
MNEVQADGGIEDINDGYSTKMEGCKILVLYTQELYAIVRKMLTFTNLPLKSSYELIKMERNKDA